MPKRPAVGAQGARARADRGEEGRLRERPHRPGGRRVEPRARVPDPPRQPQTPPRASNVRVWTSSPSRSCGGGDRVGEVVAGGVSPGSRRGRARIGRPGGGAGRRRGPPPRPSRGVALRGPPPAPARRRRAKRAAASRSRPREEARRRGGPRPGSRRRRGRARRCRRRAARRRPSRRGRPPRRRRCGGRSAPAGPAASARTSAAPSAAPRARAGGRGRASARSRAAAVAKIRLAASSSRWMRGATVGRHVQRRHRTGRASEQPAARSRRSRSRAPLAAQSIRPRPAPNRAVVRRTFVPGR